MIIEELQLNPFGGVKEALYRFEPGLNVLLGPNEAGKSTLVNALFAVLFLPPDVRKSSRDWKEFLGRCLPHPGGDTARVRLRYRCGDEECCTYSCSWGEVREAQLLLESGAEINNPAAVRERLQQALSYGRGTYQAVLFARQDEMERTLESLREDDEAVQTVAGILRRTVIEAGGGFGRRAGESHCGGFEGSFEQLGSGQGRPQEQPRHRPPLRAREGAAAGGVL